MVYRAEPEAFIAWRFGSCVEQRRLLPDQPVQLSESPHPSTVSAAVDGERFAGYQLATITQILLPGANYNYDVTQEALSLQWLPTRIKRLSFQGTYERSAVHSDISYLIPQTLGTAPSIYRENDNSLSALMSANLPFGGAKISAGGSALLGSGSRPTTYYQPVTKFTMPLGRRVSCFAEWRYYGFGETFYSYESFRTHLVIAGLRFTR